MIKKMSKEWCDAAWCDVTTHMGDLALRKVNFIFVGHALKQNIKRKMTVCFIGDKLAHLAERSDRRL